MQLNFEWTVDGHDEYRKFRIDPSGSGPERLCTAIMQAAIHMREGEG